jgi:hypothetical protein
MSKKTLSAGEVRGSMLEVDAVIQDFQMCLDDVVAALQERFNRTRSERLAEGLVFVRGSMARLNRLRIAVVDAKYALDAFEVVWGASGARRTGGPESEVGKDGDRASAGAVRAGKLIVKSGRLRRMLAGLRRVGSSQPRTRGRTRRVPGWGWRNDLERAIACIEKLDAVLNYLMENWQQLTVAVTERVARRGRIGQRFGEAERAFSGIWGAMDTPRTGSAKAKRREESRHTPGPWSVSLDFDEEGFLPHVYVLRGARGADLRQTSANLRLMAAAPVMLELLRNLFVNGATDEELATRLRRRIEWVKKARGVIAAAVNEQPTTYVHEYFEGWDRL